MMPLFMPPLRQNGPDLARHFRAHFRAPPGRGGPGVLEFAAEWTNGKV